MCTVVSTFIEQIFTGMLIKKGSFVVVLFNFVDYTHNWIWAKHFWVDYYRVKKMMVIYDSTEWNQKFLSDFGNHSGIFKDPSYLVYRLVLV